MSSSPIVVNLFHIFFVMMVLGAPTPGAGADVPPRNKSFLASVATAANHLTGSGGRPFGTPSLSEGDILPPDEACPGCRNPAVEYKNHASVCVPISELARQSTEQIVNLRESSDDQQMWNLLPDNLRGTFCCEQTFKNAIAAWAADPNSSQKGVHGINKLKGSQPPGPSGKGQAGLRIFMVAT